MEKRSFTMVASMVVLAMIMWAHTAGARNVPTTANGAAGLTDQKNFLAYGGVGGVAGLGGAGASGGLSPVNGGVGWIGGVIPGDGIGGNTGGLGGGVPGLGSGVGSGIGGGAGGSTSSGFLPFP